MGMFGGGGKKGGSSPPPAPDYASAAQQTAAGNLKLAQQQTAANRVNQQTPYGDLSYAITGQDPHGNDLWSATQTLSPQEQQLLGQTQQLGTGLLGTANQTLGNAAGSLANPQINLNNLPSTGINPGQTYTDALMARQQPQIQMMQEQSDAQLANQGITPGSEAYNNAKTLLGQQINDMRNAAAVGGLGAGLQANQQAFGQQAYNTNLPVDLINAMRQGGQVQQPSYVNPASQQFTPAADLLSSAIASGNYNVDLYNAQQAQRGNTQAGLFGLGGSLLGAAGQSGGFGNLFSGMFGG